MTAQLTNQPLVHDEACPDALRTPPDPLPARGRRQRRRKRIPGRYWNGLATSLIAPPLAQQSSASSQSRSVGRLKSIRGRVIEQPISHLNLAFVGPEHDLHAIGRIYRLFRLLPSGLQDDLAHDVMAGLSRECLAGLS